MKKSELKQIIKEVISEPSIEKIWFKNTGRNINQEEYSAMEEYGQAVLGMNQYHRTLP